MLVCFALALYLTSNTPALAQKAPAASQSKRDAPPPPAPEPKDDKDNVLAPYEPQLLRLAEIIGALAYLGEICNNPDAKSWRDKMTTLLEAEAQSPNRRDRLAGAYNRSFTSYELTHRTCTQSSRTIIMRLTREGGQLARDVAQRYGSS
jgi:uncharacterized protein (TIGR02301 family)